MKKTDTKKFPLCDTDPLMLCGAVQRVVPFVFKHTQTHFEIFSLQLIDPYKREGFVQLSTRRRFKMSSLLRQKEEALTGPHDSVPATGAGLPAGHRRQPREILRLVSFF